MKMFSAMSGQEGNQDDLISKLDSLKAVTQSVKDTFSDAAKTTFVAVCIPEFLSVYETERLVQQLAKHSIDCSHIVVNQVVFPVEGDAVGTAEEVKAASEAITDAELQSMNPKTRKKVQYTISQWKALQELYIARRRMQSKYLSQIQTLYSWDFHIVCMPLQKEEIRGHDKLKEFSQLLLTSKDLPLL
eukprot:Filipodium_phascolosomae@DN6681_c0_g1_i1.p1